VCTRASQHATACELRVSVSATCVCFQLDVAIVQLSYLLLLCHHLCAPYHTVFLCATAQIRSCARQHTAPVSPQTTNPP
jgi:hypothetical protein